MTVRERLAGARRVVTLAVALRVLLLALAGAAGTVAAVGLIDLVIALPVAGRAAVPWLALASALAVAAPIAWRARRIGDDQSLALWIESHAPLDYLLVTATDRYLDEQPAVAQALKHADFESPAGRAAWRGARGAGVTAAALLAVVILMPDAAIRRVLAPSAGDVLIRPRLGAGASRLEPLVAQYTPPGYIGGAPVTFEEPQSIGGVEGGTVEIRGPGSPDGLVAAVGPTRVTATSGGSSWSVTFDMPRAAALVRLTDSDANRLIALEPVRDSLPSVSLTLPVRDTVVRAASGKLTLRAITTDDFGLAGAWFEYVVSSGSGELFQFKTGRTGGRADGRMGGRVDSMEGALDLDSLRMGPGDVLHIRAVARDLGPARRGTGASETRTYRVTRPTDLDTAAVIALPSMPGDTAALSERLLIQITEALEARRPRLRRDVLLDESRSISRDQARLRRQVADVIFMRLSGEASAEEVEGIESDSALTPEAMLAAAEAATGQGDTAALDFAEDESPVVAVNRPLLEAYNAMWDATRELDVAALTRALPHMYQALEAIQRARAAERVYLRAPAQRGVVNLAQVRLSGKRQGVAVQGRMSGSADERIRWLGRLLGNSGGWADRRIGGSVLQDSLLVLRIDMLPEIPAAAAALNEAIRAIREGLDPRPALNTARRALINPPLRPSAHPPSAWGGAW